MPWGKVDPYHKIALDQEEITYLESKRGSKKITVLEIKRRRGKSPIWRVRGVEENYLLVKQEQGNYLPGEQERRTK